MKFDIDHIIPYFSKTIKKFPSKEELVMHIVVESVSSKIIHLDYTKAFLEARR